MAPEQLLLQRRGRRVWTEECSQHRIGELPSRDRSDLLSVKCHDGSVLRKDQVEIIAGAHGWHLRKKRRDIRGVKLARGNAIFCQAITPGFLSFLGTHVMFEPDREQLRLR